jgi:hypothetical protein
MPRENKMSKLKTLNDLIKQAEKEDELSFGGYTKDYLQNEAHEWVKVLLKYRYGSSDEQDDAKKKLGKELVEILDWDYYHLDVVCKVFMYFFNLEEG